MVRKERKEASVPRAKMLLSRKTRQTLMGVQMSMRRRSVEARLARKVLVGDLKELFCITIKMISRLPSTPSAKITL